MKGRGGDGERTMLFDMKDAEGMTKERMELEDLCSKLTSLIPQDYQLDTTSQGSSDMPSQLMQATTYIKELRERVERLKQQRDDCYRKIQRMTCGNATNTATPGSCGPHGVRVQFIGATHFDVNLTMSSEKYVELYKVIHTIEQDRRIEMIQASSWLVDDSKIAHTIKCKARSSDAVLDASMVATRLRRLLTATHAKSEDLGA